MWRQSVKVFIRSCRPGWRNSLTAWGFLLPGLCGTGIFVLLPFADVARRSFFDVWGRDFTGLRNYEEVLDNEAFRLAVWNTVRFTLCCIPLLLAVSFLLALLVHGIGRGVGRELIKTSFLTPLAVPVASVVFLWQVLFQDRGLVNRILLELGREPVSFLGSGMAFWVLVFTYIWKNAGYDMVLWLAGLSGIPESLYEAARMDGAGRLACFRYVTLPEMTGTAGLTAILSLVNSFKAFREAYLIAGSYPHESIYLLWHLFQNWFFHLEVTKLYAGAVLLVLALLLVLLVFRMAGRRVQKRKGTEMRL